MLTTELLTYRYCGNRTGSYMDLVANKTLKLKFVSMKSDISGRFSIVVSYKPGNARSITFSTEYIYITI